MSNNSTKKVPEKKSLLKNRNRQLEKFQSIIKVKFKNKSILNRSLTHRSFINEINDQINDNERLEYLGDTVLALVVNEYLFKHFEEYKEGSLAKIKSAVVSENTLAKVAGRLNLGTFILMGKGEEQNGGRDRSSILANTLEAVIGAMYLDSGLKVTRKFVLQLLKGEIELIDNLTYLRDPKTTLQEFVQKKFKERPVYEVIEERGPDHKKEFIIKLMVCGKEVTKGIGSSKRKAEMEAATTALKKINKGEINL